jgi:hypothetical protein
MFNLLNSAQFIGKCSDFFNGKMYVKEGKYKQCTWVLRYRNTTGRNEGKTVVEIPLFIGV